MISEPDSVKATSSPTVSVPKFEEIEESSTTSDAWFVSCDTSSTNVSGVVELVVPSKTCSDAVMESDVSSDPASVGTSTIIDVSNSLDNLSVMTTSSFETKFIKSAINGCSSCRLNDIISSITPSTFMFTSMFNRDSRTS